MTILHDTVAKIRAIPTRNAEVDSHQDPADAVDAAIQSLVVIRNELRMRAAAV